MRKSLALNILFVAAGLNACGGGEELVVDDFLYYEESAAPISNWTPTTAAKTVDNVAANVYLFPLSLHQRTISKSYVSKVGTTATSKYKITGVMTTPTVAAGSYSANQTTKKYFDSSVAFENFSVTPVVNENKRYAITLNGQAVEELNSNSTSYFDTTYGFYVGSSSAGSYVVLDTAFSNALPVLAAPGDYGDFVVYRVYLDSTKTVQIGARVRSYKILNVLAVASDQYRARVEWTTRDYSSQKILLRQAAVVQDLTYSVTKGAAVTTVSDVSADVSGTITSHLTWTKI